jgi:hypothetical protein
MRNFTGHKVLLILRNPGGTEIETSSVDWAQLNRLLPKDGDRIQSPKRCY